MRIKLFVLFLIFTVLLGCGKDKVVDGHAMYFFRGTVLDSLTKFPIDSAWIDAGDTLQPHLSYTDSSGWYIMKAVAYPNHPIFIFCGKEGYITKKEPALVHSYKDTTIVNFELVPVTQ